MHNRFKVIIMVMVNFFVVVFGATMAASLYAGDGGGGAEEEEDSIIWWNNKFEFEKELPSDSPSDAYYPPAHTPPRLPPVNAAPKPVPLKWRTKKLPPMQKALRDDIKQVFIRFNLKYGNFSFDAAPQKGVDGIYVIAATLQEDTNITGWSYLNIVDAAATTTMMRNDEGEDEKPGGGGGGGVNDSVKAYAAGMAEGLLTRHLIDLHWRNTLGDYCTNKDRAAYCKRLEMFIRTNLDWANKMISSERIKSSYWNHVALWFEQLSGLEDGATWNDDSAKKQHFLGPRTYPRWPMRFYLMSLNGDLGDLEQALKLKPTLRRPPRGGCSALVKAFFDSSKDARFNNLVTAHTTWTEYTDMLRIIKFYDFSLHSHVSASSTSHNNDCYYDSRSRDVALAASFKMSSYPGFLTSVDDFYVSSKHLAITETTIGNYNKTLWSFVKPIGTLPTAIRGIVATRLANQASDWAQLFSNFNSGTYNNEWIIVDYNAWEDFVEAAYLRKSSRRRIISPKKSPFIAGGNNRRRRNQRIACRPILMILDQMPGAIQVVDATDTLLGWSSPSTYFASYNLPSIPSMVEWSNTTGQIAAYGDLYDHDRCPRARIFARNVSMLRDIGDMLTLMRFNNFRYDPLSRCESCRPNQNAELAIAARSDLNDRSNNSFYPLDMLKFRLHGAIDAKIVDSTFIKWNQFVSVSGPTNSQHQQPIFAWSSANVSTDDFAHFGQPDEFDFEPVIYE